jgi:hypothetical protein
MVDAGTLLDEARKNGISVMCHGHKHMSHRIGITLPHANSESIAIIGCGSTTAINGGEQSANLIDVSASGCVSIKTYVKSASEWKELGSPLNARAWPQVKKHLATAAGKLCHYSTNNVRCEYTILPHGDVVSTIEYDGVAHKEKDNRGFAMLPLGVQSTHPKAPSLAAKSGFTEYEFVENVASQDSWQGFFKYRPTAGEVVIALQNIAHCAFATNLWQFWGLYGRQSQRSIARKEWLGLNCTWPVNRRMEITVRLSESTELRFTDIEPICDLPEERPDVDEREDMRWQSSPSGKLFCAQLDTPRWGNSYGLQWKWSQNERLVASNKTEELRERLEHATADAQLSGVPDVCARLSDLLNSPLVPWKDVEANVWILCRGDGTARATLRQLAWNDVTKRDSLHAVVLPFGAGVVGRAIWMRRSVPWVTPQSDELEDQLANYYYKSNQRESHTAVIAYPLSLHSASYPIAALSLGTRKHGEFFDLTKAQFSTSPKERSKGGDALAVCSKLRNAIQELIVNY